MNGQLLIPAYTMSMGAEVLSGMPGAGAGSGGGALEGYWGPVTSSLDWCEPNFGVTIYIAEFWNTVSNIVFVLLGLLGLRLSILHGFERRFQVIFASVVITGVGSALFHGSLKHWTQQSDETPMVWSILAWLYLLYAPDLERFPRCKNLVPVALVVYALVFSIVHFEHRFTTFFQVHFLSIVLLCNYRLYQSFRACDDPAVQHLAKVYTVSMVIASLWWFIDFNFCENMQKLPVNPQGHAWWHVFMGFNVYMGPTLAQFMRAKSLGMSPVIRYWHGVVPYACTTKLP